MVSSYDRLTTELKRSCLRLKDELIFTPQRIRNSGEQTENRDARDEAETFWQSKYENDIHSIDLDVECEGLGAYIEEGFESNARCPEFYYHIEIPSASKFYRIGYSEYVFVSMLDGETSFAHALAVTAQKLGHRALSENQATQLVQWLLQNGLAGFADGTTIADPTQNEQNQPSLFQKLNPFWLKLPLGNPNRFLNALQPHFRWLFSPLAVFVSVLMIIGAAITVFSNWDSFQASSKQIFSPNNWIWMLVTWVGLKVVHELAHGLVCNRFGGKVKDTGIIFILFAPMAYVDVTSSWRFGSRWKRIAVAMAGMYIELLIAAICVFAWCYTTNPTISFQLFNIVFMASITTILFNANPLMRFDGYFALSDFLKIPNLYTAGSKSFSRQMKWLFYGQVEEDSFRELDENNYFVPIYGICAACWKVIICFSLAITASVMFGGLGILLAMFGSVSWFGKPAKKLCEQLLSLYRIRPQSVFRAAVVSSFIALAFASSWFWVPNPFSVQSPCVVDFEEQSKVRSNSAGFVREVLVENGQAVQEGQELLVLENKELTMEIAEIRAELEQHKTRERIAVDQQDFGQAQIERKNVLAKQSILNETLEEANELVLTAPVAGRVVARNLKLKLGTYVERGDIVVTIGDENNKELILSIGEKEAQSFGKLVGTQVPVQIGSQRRLHARIKRVEPQASVSIRNESLITPHGGNLAVQQNSSAESEQDSRFELIAPRFHAVASIDKDISKRLFCGQRGAVVLKSSSPTIGKWLYQSVKDWIEAQLRMSQAIAEES